MACVLSRRGLEARRRPAANPLVPSPRAAPKSSRFSVGIGERRQHGVRNWYESCGVCKRPNPYTLRQSNRVERLKRTVAIASALQGRELASKRR